MAQKKTLTNGRAAAAVLAAGVGSLALGLFTTVSEAIAPLNQALNLYNPTGPLSGKTTAAVVVWLVAWMVVHRRWKDRQVDFDRAFVAALVMVALGLLGTFPLFFELFGGT